MCVMNVCHENVSWYLMWNKCVSWICLMKCVLWMFIMNVWHECVSWYLVWYKCISWMCFMNVFYNWVSWMCVMSASLDVSCELVSLPYISSHSLASQSRTVSPLSVSWMWVMSASRDVSCEINVFCECVLWMCFIIGCHECVSWVRPSMFRVS